MDQRKVLTQALYNELQQNTYHSNTAIRYPTIYGAVPPSSHVPRTHENVISVDMGALLVAQQFEASALWIAFESEWTDLLDEFLEQLRSHHWLFLARRHEGSLSKTQRSIHQPTPLQYIPQPPLASLSSPCLGSSSGAAQRRRPHPSLPPAASNTSSSSIPLDSVRSPPPTKQTSTAHPSAAAATEQVDWFVPPIGATRIVAEAESRQGGCTALVPHSNYEIHQRLWGAEQRLTLLLEEGNHAAVVCIEEESVARRDVERAAEHSTQQMALFLLQVHDKFRLWLNLQSKIAVYRRSLAFIALEEAGRLALESLCFSCKWEVGSSHPATCKAAAAPASTSSNQWSDMDRAYCDAMCDTLSRDLFPLPVDMACRTFEAVSHHTNELEVAARTFFEGIDHRRQLLLDVAGPPPIHRTDRDLPIAISGMGDEATTASMELEVMMIASSPSRTRGGGRAPQSPSSSRSWAATTASRLSSPSRRVGGAGSPFATAADSPTHRRAMNHFLDDPFPTQPQSSSPQSTMTIAATNLLLRDSDDEGDETVEERTQCLSTELLTVSNLLLPPLTVETSATAKLDCEWFWLLGGPEEDQRTESALNKAHALQRYLHRQLVCPCYQREVSLWMLSSASQYSARPETRLSCSFVAFVMQQRSSLEQMLLQESYEVAHRLRVLYLGLPFRSTYCYEKLVEEELHERRCLANYVAYVQSRNGLQTRPSKQAHHTSRAIGKPTNTPATAVAPVGIVVAAVATPTPLPPAAGKSDHHDDEGGSFSLSDGEEDTSAPTVPIQSVQLPPPCDNAHPDEANKIHSPQADTEEEEDIGNTFLLNYNGYRRCLVLQQQEAYCRQLLEQTDYWGELLSDFGAVEAYYRTELQDDERRAKLVMVAELETIHREVYEECLESHARQLLLTKARLQQNEVRRRAETSAAVRLDALIHSVHPLLDDFERHRRNQIVLLEMQLALELRSLLRALQASDDSLTEDLSSSANQLSPVRSLMLTGSVVTRRQLQEAEIIIFQQLVQELLVKEHRFRTLFFLSHEEELKSIVPPLLMFHRLCLGIVELEREEACHRACHTLWCVQQQQRMKWNAQEAEERAIFSLKIAEPATTTFPLPHQTAKEARLPLHKLVLGCVADWVEMDALAFDDARTILTAILM